MHPEQYCRHYMQTVVFLTSQAILHLFFTAQRALLAFTEQVFAIEGIAIL